jgi:sugar lactone lactonase YvrE
LQIQRTDETIHATDAGLINQQPAIAYHVGNRVGESPAWHARQSALYWIDVRGQQLLKLKPAASTLTRWHLPDVVGASALCRSGKVWLALRHRLASLDTATGELTDIAAVEADVPDNRLNDGKVSPSGRWFLFGSMDDRPQKQPTGALYCASVGGSVRKLWDGLTVCNGIAFSPDASVLYFSDSAQGRVMRADWNEAEGTMGEPVLWCGLGEAQGRPDGAAIDASGHYWSAGVSAGCLNEVGADGKLLRTIALPCRAPTMPAFGGDGAEMLYVTSLVRDAWAARGAYDGAVIAFPAPAAGSYCAVLAD